METNSQVAPLCAILEDPETPVLTEVGDLILRVVIRTKTVFHGQTRIPKTSLVDNFLRVRFDTTKNEQLYKDSTTDEIPHESTWRN